MKTCVHPNSIAAYHDVKLSKRQQEVIEALQVLGRATDQQIADYMDFDINRITPRVGELIAKKVIIEDGNVMGNFGKPVRVNKLKQMETLF